jgi:hypothetical protein
LGNALGNASASAQADNPASIPDLSVMDVIGNLKYFASDVPFRCTGPMAAEGDNILWSCAAYARGERGSYEVTLVGDDPLTIFSVTATVHGVSEETATSFFSYVVGLCLRDTDPLNPEAWMQEKVPTGGQTTTGGKCFRYTVPRRFGPSRWCRSTPSRTSPLAGIRGRQLR